MFLISETNNSVLTEIEMARPKIRRSAAARTFGACAVNTISIATGATKELTWRWAWNGVAEYKSLKHLVSCRVLVPPWARALAQPYANLPLNRLISTSVNGFVAFYDGPPIVLGRSG